MQIFLTATPIPKHFFRCDCLPTLLLKNTFASKNSFKEATWMAHNVKLLCMNSCLTSVGTHRENRSMFFRWLVTNNRVSLPDLSGMCEEVVD